jgi:hypothetical protein
MSVHIRGLSCIVSDRAYRVLERVSRETGRGIEELAEAAIEEAALNAETGRGRSDPEHARAA